MRPISYPDLPHARSTTAMGGAYPRIVGGQESDDRQHHGASDQPLPTERWRECADRGAPAIASPRDRTA